MTSFRTAYDAVLARWPADVESRDVPTDFGPTHVLRCGPPDAPPLVLLHAHGATSTVWVNNVAALSRDHRVHAVDLIGDAGRSVHDGRPLKRPADLMDWLDQATVGLGPVDVCGHSYGAWLGLSWAVHAPDRVRRLVLLDPTDCFVGLALPYRLRAVPLFVRPGRRTWLRFLGWETRGVAVDPGWRELSALAAEQKGGALVLPRRPGRSTVPTLVLVAEHSKAHDVRRLADRARERPGVTVATLPGATHHSIPTAGADRLNEEIIGHLF